MNKRTKAVTCSVLMCATSAFAGTATDDMTPASTTYHQTPIQLVQPASHEGEMITHMQLVNEQFKPEAIAGAQSGYQFIATTSSVFTPTGVKEIQKLNTYARMWSNLSFYAVTRDLPYALSYFAKTHDVRHVTLLSNYQNMQFGKAFGTTITHSKDNAYNGLNANAIFVMQPDGRMAHRQFVDEMTDQYNYDQLAATLRKMFNRA